MNQGGTEGSFHRLLDGHSYKTIKELDVYPADLEEIFWSHSDPDTFYYVSRKKEDRGLFKKYSVSKDSSEVVADFSAYCGAGSGPTAGSGVQMQSADDDLWAFRCELDNKDFIALSYRMSSGI